MGSHHCWAKLPLSLAVIEQAVSGAVEDRPSTEVTNAKTVYRWTRAVQIGTSCSAVGVSAIKKKRGALCVCLSTAHRSHRRRAPSVVFPTENVSPTAQPARQFLSRAETLMVLGAPAFSGPNLAEYRDDLKCIWSRVTACRHSARLPGIR